ncbi:MAG: pirin family protein [Myxococcota bacterium]
MTIRLTLPAHAHSLGALTVRRTLPAHERQMVGPFIFMETGGPVEIPRDRAQGVPEHPHAGLSTFTYLMEGAIHHQDSAGYSETIHAGDIALMTSGRGISHEELPANPTSKSNERVYFAQMWLALPDELEEMEPTFELHRAEDLPKLENADTSVRLAMGKAWGLEAPTTCHAPTLFADLNLNAGAQLDLDADYKEIAVMVLEGDASIDGTPLPREALHILEPSAKSLGSNAGCRALVLGGDPFTSSRVIGGSFVASSETKLLRWMSDAQRGNWPSIQRT